MVSDYKGAAKFKFGMNINVAGLARNVYRIVNIGTRIVITNRDFSLKLCSSLLTENFWRKVIRLTNSM